MVACCDYFELDRLGSGSMDMAETRRFGEQSAFCDSWKWHDVKLVMLKVTRERRMVAVAEM